MSFRHCLFMRGIVLVVGLAVVTRAGEPARQQAIPEGEQSSRVKVKVILDEKYPEELEPPGTLEATKALLEAVGLQPASGDAEDADYMLRVTVRSSSKGATYGMRTAGGPHDGKFLGHFQGLSYLRLEGQIAWSGKEIDREAAFIAEQKYGKTPAPKNALHHLLFDHSDYFMKLYEIVASIWGIDRILPAAEAFAKERGYKRTIGAVALVVAAKTDHRHIPKMIAALEAENAFWTVRKRFTDALVAIGQPSVAPLIQVLGSSESPITQRCAVDALGAIGGTRAVGPLIEALAVETLTDAAGYALALIGDSRGKAAAVAPLIGCLNWDNKPMSQENAARALGLIGDRKAIQPLEELLSRKANDKGPFSAGIRAAAIDSIERIRGSTK
jgi:hypothetical protein